MKKPKILIVTIATGKYLRYFERNLPSWKRAFDSHGDVVFQVLTDAQPAAFQAPFPGITVTYQEPLNWPEITLFRYAILLERVDFVSYDFVVWIDADMEGRGAVPIGLLQSGKMTLAQHPGYEWPALRRTSISWLEKAARLLSILTKANFGLIALGDWEDRKVSMAYVPTSARKIYVHGAIWMGPSSQVREMCELLADRTSEDWKNGVVARWHDESHLNWFAAFQKVEIAKNGFSDWELAFNYGIRRPVFISQDKSKLDAETRSH